MNTITKDLSITAERIKEVRLKLGLSMSDFAARIDDRARGGTVSNWENAKNAPNAERIRRIADLGHVDVDYILGKTNDPISDNWWTQLSEKAARYTSLQRALSDNYESLGKSIYQAGSRADEYKLEKIASIIVDAEKQINNLK
ncbi:helix-turn-helix domain-containing protein [Lactiplantibacillus nangangensis]|uniref:Helix-turn-helix domain-containing protein n=1 Tax=Lactiplantibacillus nangangensis TaxID=2559917 RepID=A0ABW1SKF8_9LACO|nr:helix-turn-helix transcriptional regulator [Lactiplantibacillus nangangensis]